MGPIQSSVNQTIQNIGVISKLKGIEKSTTEQSNLTKEINERTKKKYDALIKETENSQEWKDISSALNKFKNDPDYRAFDVDIRQQAIDRAKQQYQASRRDTHYDQY